MKKLIPSIFAGALFALSSHASVTLNFNSDLQGFGGGGNGGTFGWSSVNGGSLALTNSSGYHDGMVTLNLGNYPAIWAELQKAQANGGFLSFDIFIRTNEQVYTGNPFVQVICVGNSDTGGWKDNNIGYTTFPISGAQNTIHALLPIKTTGTGGDGNFVVSGAWALLQFGLQFGSGVTSGTVYIDNVKILGFDSPTPDFSFDTDLQGFGGSGNGGTFGWSSVNGGSMALTNTAGWHGSMVGYGLGNSPAIWTKLNNSLANGGTLSFDATFRTSDQVYTAGGNAWLQLIVVGNSELGGWKDNNLATTPLPVGGGATTKSIVLPITATGPGGGGTFVASGAWANLELGLQNGSGITSGVVYIDNIRITPEPATVISPLITYTVGGGNLKLDWTATGFKLQTTSSLSPTAWTDVPAGDTPPVVVPIDPANRAAFYRLAPQ